MINDFKKISELRTELDLKGKKKKLFTGNYKMV